MEIIRIDSEQERLFCPSTGEVIFSPDLDEITLKPKAVLAIWDHQFIDKPEIYEPKLKNGWNNFFLKWWNARITIEMVERFLSEYENPDWKVCKFNLEGIACGPISCTLLYVVKADTIVEEHPLFIDEDPMPDQVKPMINQSESGNTINEITDDEIIKYILSNGSK